MWIAGRSNPHAHYLFHYSPSRKSPPLPYRSSPPPLPFSPFSAMELENWRLYTATRIPYLCPFSPPLLSLYLRSLFPPPPPPHPQRRVVAGNRSEMRWDKLWLQVLPHAPPIHFLANVFFPPFFPPLSPILPIEAHSNRGNASSRGARSRVDQNFELSVSFCLHILFLPPPPFWSLLFFLYFPSISECRVVLSQKILMRTTIWQVLLSTG